MNAKLRRYTHWVALALIVLVSRLYLLRTFDVELSQDGFEAVRTLNLLQAQGLQAVPPDLRDRFLLHPLYMLLLAACRLLTPVAADFYLTARFLSALLAVVAVILLFEFTRNAFPSPLSLPGRGNIAAWCAALFLAFAPTVLWESITILSSTLFLALYLAVLLALLQSRYRVAALLAFLASLTRYEGVVLFALILLALVHRDWQARTSRPAGMPAPSAGHRGDWIAALAPVLAFPLTLLATGWIASGNPLEFLGAQSMASIWLRFLAPGDFAKRGAFFVTQYAQLLPSPLVALGVIGAVVALMRYRSRATALLLAIAALYLVFFETLVWFNYTTLEVRFLMYPGFPLLVFAALGLATAAERVPAGSRAGTVGAVVVVGAAMLALLGASYQQGIAGMQFQYRMMASQREVADELAQIVPAERTTNLLSYTGNSGALDLFGRQHGLQFTFTDFRYAPDKDPEQFVVERDIQYIVYPVGNAFAKAKYPYLARFETQTHGAVTFRPLTQFATTLDNQLYSIWSVTW